MNSGAHKLRGRGARATPTAGFSVCGCRVTTASVLGCSLVVAVSIFVFVTFNSHMMISVEGGGRATVDFAKFITNRYTTLGGQQPAATTLRGQVRHLCSRCTLPCA